MSRLGSILLWSVLAAAFIGPGTVTTAASAGAGHGLALLWALGYSTVACLVLQEASARLTVVSGSNLGQALRQRYPGGLRGGMVLLVVLGAVVLGCAAYEAGNILGGVAGAMLVSPVPKPVLTLACGLVAGLLLWTRPPTAVAKILGILVATMGVAFLWTALLMRPSPVEIAQGLLVPRLPAGSGLLALGLVGTTVVPYNLFLGSGLAKGQKLEEIRPGIAVAVILGGFISIGVLVVGTGIEGEFSFAGLSRVLSERLGAGASTLFAVGLFGAGLSSAVTAPLAAAMTARSMLAFGEGGDVRWGDRSWRYRAVWLAVLAAGVGFGLTDVRPIPAIILAQALNGLLLPLVAVFLFLAVNDRALMGEEGINGRFANGLTASVVAVSLVLGVSGVLRAGSRVLGLPSPGGGLQLLVAAGVGVLLAPPLVAALRRRRSAKAPG